MKAQDLQKPAVPVVYIELILRLAQERGVAREALLADLGICEGLLQKADGRLSLLQTSQVLYRALKLTDDPALGYEIGLHSNVATHGFIGYGVMSYTTLREALEFGRKFLQLRLPNLSIRLLVDGSNAAVDVSETTPLGALRQCMFDLFLVGIARIGSQITGGLLAPQREVEIWFDYPQPPYFDRYRDRLPKTRFATGVNQLRFPAAYLDRRLSTADPGSAQLVTQQLERELTLLGYSGDFAGRVRAALVMGPEGYPDLEAVAEQLRLSGRTLKRRLQAHGLSFQGLLDETRRRDSIRLLSDSALSVEQVALRVGYSDPANFTRAFRKWTGRTPSAYRHQLRESVTPG
jgi:AraC-like DNA-binding protein